MAKDYVEERNAGYYVAGTRVSLDSIIQCFNEGLSPEASARSSKPHSDSGLRRDHFPP